LFFLLLFAGFEGLFCDDNMFSLARRRREAERHKKLEEQFTKADSNGNGKITPEQLVKIYEANEVIGEAIIF
jgi:Ca2+-binding EF-hand superfamily protein